MARGGSTAWAVAFTIVAVVAVFTAAGLFVFHSLRSLPGDVVTGGLEVAGRFRDLAVEFRQGTVRTSFVGYATQVTGTNFLQVATLRQTEIYTQEDDASLLWGRFALPSVVVAATAPVEYTFYVDLEDTWELDLADGVLSVTAPPIRLNSPAIDVGELHFDVRSSSLLRDEEAVVEKLRAALTQLARERGADHVALVRDTARRRTEDFVRTWLSATFRDAGRYVVEVTFADEVPGARPGPAPAPG